jgi:hypothetical protein
MKILDEELRLVTSLQYKSQLIKKDTEIADLMVNNEILKLYVKYGLQNGDEILPDGTISKLKRDEVKDESQQVS